MKTTRLQFLYEKVLVDAPPEQSPAAGILLKRDLLSIENFGKADGSYWLDAVRVSLQWLESRRSSGGMLICTYCGMHPLDISGDDYRTNATRDHIYPKSKGGSDDDRNLCVACHGCNSIKKDLLVTDKRLNGRLKWVGRDLRLDPLAPSKRWTQAEWVLDWPYWRRKKVSVPA